MSDFQLLLDILRKAQLATPAILAIISAITRGREEGKTDDEIKAESMALAVETKEITQEDMGIQP